MRLQVDENVLSESRLGGTAYQVPNMKQMVVCWTRCSSRVLSLCRSVSPFQLARFLNRVRRHAGNKFFVFLICNYLLIRGAQGGLTRAALLPYVKKLGYTGAMYQRVACISDIPFCLKGLVGTLSDRFPIGGYRKKYYMVIGALSGAAGVAALSFFPDSVGVEHVWLISVSVFLCFFELATLALMCSGTYSEMMVERPEIGSDFVTFCYLMYNLGNLAGRSVAGTLADSVGGRPVFYIVLPIAIHILLPIFYNCLPEKRIASGSKTTSVVQHPGLFFSMALFIAAGSVGLAVVNIIMLEWLSVLYCLGVLVAFPVALFYTVEKVVAKCCTYVFLWAAVNVSVSGAIDYFMTAPATCLKDGPHFSYTHYTTYTSVLGTLATLIAIWLFQCYFVNWSYVHVSWITSAIKGLAAIFDYIIVTRTTSRLGIPDTAVFLLGDAIVLPVINALHSMPAFMLTSKLCPPGLESTAYAIMDGASYAGLNIGSQLGAVILDRSGISTNEAHGCNFENLGTLVLTTQLAIPIATIPFAFYLLPQVPVCADLRYSTNDSQKRKVQTGATPVAAEDQLPEQSSGSSTAALSKT